MSEKSKVQQIVNDNINEKFAESKKKNCTEREINTESGSPQDHNSNIENSQKKIM